MMLANKNCVSFFLTNQMCNFIWAGTSEMKTGTPRTATQASKSVVIVTDGKQGGDYCSGFVTSKVRIIAGISSTLVVAPSAFVRGNVAQLSISFFDGVQSPASVVAREESFCLLRTVAHPRCESIRWLKDDLAPSCFTPGRTFMWPPMSCNDIYYQPTFTTLESLESYETYYEDSVAGSKSYFMIACDYNQNTCTGLTRLAGAPVFTLESGKSKDSGSVMGVVLQNCRPGELCGINVVVTSGHFIELMKKLDPPPTLSLSVGQKRGGVQKRGRDNQAGGVQKRGRDKQAGGIQKRGGGNQGVGHKRGGGGGVQKR